MKSFVSRVARDALIFALIVAGPAGAAETLVHNVAEFDAAVKAAKPGDTIVMANGEWRDAELVFRGEGKLIPGDNGFDTLPITLRAETPGNVILTGKSRLRIGGKHLVVRDLLWRMPDAVEDVISFRFDSKTLAEYCEVTQCAIIGDTAGKHERKWVSIYGRENKVSSCRFEGKQSAGTLLVVWLSEGPTKNQIIANFFGPRGTLGKNGGEIIRVGDSKTSMIEASSEICNNYFYQCDGEAEIISNKSGKNLYCLNRFVGCSGALTLRHGNSCRVSRNCFIGDGRKGTGGVRVIGEDHMIDENLFLGLTGDGTRAAVSLMNGIPDSPLNGYFQVKRCRVLGNYFVSCKESIVIGIADEDHSEQKLPPREVGFGDNHVVSEKQSVFVVRSKGEQIFHSANSYFGETLGIEPTAGWAKVPELSDRMSILSLLNETGTQPFWVWQVLRQDSLDTWEARIPGPSWMRPGDEYLPKLLQKK